MKPLALLVLGCLLGGFWASAQEKPAAGTAAGVAATPVPAPSSVAAAPSISTPPVLRPAPGKPGLRLEPGLKPRKSKKQVGYEYEGIFVRASRMEDPKQLVNPKAPASLGNGEGHVSKNPHTGRAEGIRLFGIRF